MARLSFLKKFSVGGRKTRSTAASRVLDDERATGPRLVSPWIVGIRRTTRRSEREEPGESQVPPALERVQDAHPASSAASTASTLTASLIDDIAESLSNASINAGPAPPSPPAVATARTPRRVPRKPRSSISARKIINRGRPKFKADTSAPAVPTMAAVKPPKAVAPHSSTRAAPSWIATLEDSPLRVHLTALVTDSTSLGPKHSTFVRTSSALQRTPQDGDASDDDDDDGESESDFADESYSSALFHQANLPSTQPLFSPKRSTARSTKLHHRTLSSPSASPPDLPFLASLFSSVPTRSKMADNNDLEDVFGGAATTTSNPIAPPTSTVPSPPVNDSNQSEEGEVVKNITASFSSSTSTDSDSEGDDRDDDDNETVSPRALLPGRLFLPSHAVDDSEPNAIVTEDEDVVKILPASTNSDSEAEGNAPHPHLTGRHLLHAHQRSSSDPGSSPKTFSSILRLHEGKTKSVPAPSIVIGAGPRPSRIPTHPVKDQNSPIVHSRASRPEMLDDEEEDVDEEDGGASSSAASTPRVLKAKRVRVRPGTSLRTIR
ncbi:hypothetical protein RQP46_002092 [Phenoliferia psychrophenolica]